MKVKGLLLDVEGTIVKDKRYLPVSGAVEFLREIRRRDLPVRLVTNNTTDSRPEICEKLSSAGFDFPLSEIHTCIGAAARHLRDIDANRCLVVGRAGLKKMFVDEGFSVVSDSDADAVVVGLDTDLTYETLAVACDALVRCGASLIALHRNRLYIDELGRSSPSVGAIVEALSYAAGVEPVLIGKPGREYYQQVLDDMGMSPGDVMVISDDPFSDLVGARRMGMSAALVLSGKYSDRSVVDRIASEERPHIIVDTVGDLVSGGWI